MRCLLFFSRTTKSTLELQSGFTLLELLVVIFLITVIAGTALLGYEGVQDQGRDDITQFEMAEIRKALLQFRRDSGSHDFPKQGQYDCANMVNFPSNIASLTATEKQGWCNSSANFVMLFENPLDDPATPGIEGGWNSDTHRGWNGPYLQNKRSLVSYSGIDFIPTITTPYQSPYLLDLSAPESILSMGSNGISGAISSCQSDDDDDYVVCLLQ